MMFFEFAPVKLIYETLFDQFFFAQFPGNLRPLKHLPTSSIPWVSLYLITVACWRKSLLAVSTPVRFSLLPLTPPSPLPYPRVVYGFSSLPRCGLLSYCPLQDQRSDFLVLGSHQQWIRVSGQRLQWWACHLCEGNDLVLKLANN